LEKKTEDQVKDLYGKLDQERAGREEINKQLLRTQAEMRAAEERIQKILKEDVWPVRPPPDAEAKAFEPDGRVILIDSQAKIVHINLGSEERIYRGLTFSVYDKGQPIPRDGKGKAEIEVYNVGDSVSAARIVRSEPKNPVVVDDIVANLIWDSKKTNTFVVAGDFDLNGTKGTDAIEKIRGLVEKWGGKVADSVSVNTDFVILGTPPTVPQKPTLEETETYPNAMEKYERAVERLANYKQIQSQAEALSIPILNADRFLYFIGYKTQAGKPGAF
jgi:NAD-dependent DNA ligase